MLTCFCLVCYRISVYGRSDFKFRLNNSFFPIRISRTFSLRVKSYKPTTTLPNAVCQSAACSQRNPKDVCNYKTALSQELSLLVVVAAS